MTVAIEEYIYGLVQGLFSRAILPLSQIKSTAQLVYISSVIHGLLVAKRTCTLRSIFYRSMTAYAGLLQNQPVVSKYVELLRCSLNCARRSRYDYTNSFLLDLGVFATAKGLVSCGDFMCKLFAGDFSITDLRSYSDGLIISSDVAGSIRVESDAERVLIVEKDTIFHVIFVLPTF